MLKENS